MPNIDRRERFISAAASLACVTVIPNSHAVAITLGSNNSQSLSISALKAVWISGGPIMSGGMMSTHASILVDSVGPPSAEVRRTAASFP
jgi:hypothetical protein